MSRSLNPQSITVVRPGGTVTPFNDNEHAQDRYPGVYHLDLGQDDGDNGNDNPDGDNQDVNYADHV